MKIVIEGSPKEIAALVLELQERQVIEKLTEMDWDDSGVKLCADHILEDE